MNANTTRRTVYTFINRNDLPGIFRSFDYADTDSSAPDRPQTTVPQQALFAMNSPFVQEQARRLAEDCQRGSTDENKQLELLFHRIFSRNPSDLELRRSKEFLASSPSTEQEKLIPFARLVQVLLMTNEFIFVD